MKQLIKMAACLLLVAPTLAMTPKTDATTTPHGWVRHAAPGAMRDGGSFTIAMPADLIFKPSRGIDSYVADYERSDMSIGLDFGIYGDSRCDSECQTISVDGVNSHRTRFAPERKDRIGIFYYVPIEGKGDRAGKISVTVTALCSSKASCDTADAIVQSIKLLPATNG